jgi:hypothetical protein
MSTDAIDVASPLAINDTASSLIPVSAVLDDAVRVFGRSIGGASLSSLLLLLVVVALVVGLVADHNVLVDAWSIFVL